ncbi:MAG: retropepsin-like aspartic protease [Bacteroidota bacterium]
MPKTELRKIRFILFVFFLTLGYQTRGMADSEIITTPDNLLYKSLLLRSSQGYVSIDDEKINHYAIALKRAGRLIILDAIIDGISGNLILDTGSAELVLNSIYFRDSNRRTQLTAGGITGSTGTVSTTKTDSINIANLFFFNQRANVTDLGHIEKARNIKVLGFFGLKMLNDFEVMIDLKNNHLELHRLHFSGRRMNDKMELPVYDLELNAKVQQSVFFIEGMINRKKLTFCLDTGAESNVIGNHLPDKVLNTVSILRRSEMRGAGNRNIEVLHGIMNDFSISRKKIKGMNILITNMYKMSKFYGVRIDGMLGCDFLEKGVFYINLKKEMIGIVLNEEDKNEN